MAGIRGAAVWYASCCCRTAMKVNVKQLTVALAASALTLLCTVVVLRYVGATTISAANQGAGATRSAPPPGDLDSLLAPIALYPDPLLAQMLISASDPESVSALDKWLTANSTLKGPAAQDAAVLAGFE